MKKFIFLSLMLMVAASYTSKASTAMYRVDDASIEAIFEAAKPLALPLSAASSLLSPLHDQKMMADKNVWIAVLLDFFLGGIAIHRVYLGGTPVLILGYLITFGGIFGIVPLVDLIVLIINNENISKYVGNNRFFMWG